MFRMQENALAPARTGDTAASVMDAASSEQWNSWWDGRAAIERKQVLEIVAATVGEFASGYIHEKLTPIRRELDTLQAENVELKRMLTEALQRLTILGVQAETATQAREASTALTVRLARLEGLFAGKMSQLANFADSVGALPRGWGND
jgi:hypothetical protein